MSWVQFGSSGHVKQPKSVIDGFRLRRRYETVVRVETKQIVRMKEVDHLGVHEHAICGWVIVDGCLHPADNICAADTDENYIKNAELLMNHYQVQSKDWFTKVKMTRGDAVHQVNVRDEAYFLQYRYLHRIFKFELLHQSRNDFVFIFYLQPGFSFHYLITSPDFLE